MKISLKLILVGTLIMAIPLVMVASFSVTKARTGLIANTNEEVTKLTHEIAQELDLSIQGEIKLLLSMANDPDIIAAAATYNDKMAGKLTGKEEQRVAALIDRANAKLAPLRNVKELSSTYEGTPVVGLNGVCFANSDLKALEVVLADRA